jgi:hypothetical protein
MTSIGIPIPELDPPWPADRTIVIVSSDGSSPGWRMLAHQVVATFQVGRHSFPLAENATDSRTGPRRKAFLFRRADQVRGCLIVADKAVTGYLRPRLGTARLPMPNGSPGRASSRCGWHQKCGGRVPPGS